MAISVTLSSDQLRKLLLTARKNYQDKLPEISAMIERDTADLESAKIIYRQYKAVEEEAWLLRGLPAHLFRVADDKSWVVPVSELNDQLQETLKRLALLCELNVDIAFDGDDFLWIESIITDAKLKKLIAYLDKQPQERTDYWKRQLAASYAVLDEVRATVAVKENKQAAAPKPSFFGKRK